MPIVATLAPDATRWLCSAAATIFKAGPSGKGAVLSRQWRIWAVHLFPRERAL